MHSTEWGAQAVKRLDALITDKIQLTEILFYLGQEADENNGYQNSQEWKGLKYNLDYGDKVFITYAQHLLQEADKNTQKICDSMRDVCKNLDLPKMTNVNGQPWSPNTNALELSRSLSFAQFFGHVTPETQLEIFDNLPQITNLIAASIPEREGFAVSANDAKIALAVVDLTYETMKNIYRWWNDEISGEQAVKNIIAASARTAVAAGVSTAGAAVGSAFGPIGMVVGGAAGNIVAKILAGESSDKFTLKPFNVFKAEELERAYNYLDVEYNATNDKINNAFRSLCLKCHPDKGGSQQSFQTLQYYMAIIKVAKGEKYC